MSNFDLNNLGRARDALQRISPHLSRYDWVRVGMAAQAAGLSFEDFDNWSSGGDTYDAPSCKATWKSFKADKGIGPGTLFAIARERGYVDRKPLQSNFKTFANANSKSSMPSHGLAVEVWERCEDATIAHPYIVEKRAVGVPMANLRVLPAADDMTICGESMAGALVVPVFQTDGLVSSLQFIALPDVAKRLKEKGRSGKLNLPGASIVGWHVVGEMVPGGLAYICEGIATAWVCWQATGVAAVVCFGWGRVGKVAGELRKLDNTARLVIVPDAGKELDATKIAKKVQAVVACMPNGSPANFDANDLTRRDGIDALSVLLQAAKVPEPPLPMLKPVSILDVLSNPSPPPEFIWEGYLPRGFVTLLGAHGGAGKTTMALMLAVCTALGLPLFGITTVQCKTLFLSLEDSVQIVRHRLAVICRMWGIDPDALQGKLHIVDGTENPELFTADHRSAGETTPTYSELKRYVQLMGVELVVVDNASDAFGGDEIQMRQVRAFMRALMEVVRLINGALLLLAHVDKVTSRARNSAGGEGYSGSTAWHNTSRSRLFMSLKENGTLTLEHQKSNFGKMRETLILEWPDAGLPQLMSSAIGGGHSSELSSSSRLDDERATVLLRMIAEFESRQQYCSTGITSRNHVYAVLKSEPSFQKLKLGALDVKRIVTQCQRANWIEPLDYRDGNRKPHQRWTLTTEGRNFAGLFALTAPTAPVCHEAVSGAGGASSAPIAPTA